MIDSMLSIPKNKSHIMKTSTLLMKQSLIENHELKFQQKLNHINCFCYHCINDTKPLQKPYYQRISAQNEYKLNDNQAYSFMLSSMINYFGIVKVPDTFIAQRSSLIYFSSNKNRIKQKSNLPPNQVKKIFDAKRVLYSKIHKSQLTKQQNSIDKLQRNMPRISNTSENLTFKKSSLTQNQQGTKQDRQMKEIAIINYKDNFNQIVTESCLNKYLLKRKNDPFWQEIISISLIPPYKQKQLNYHQFYYQRNLKTLPQTQQIMEQVAYIVDQQQGMYNKSNNHTALNPQNQIGLQRMASNSLQNTKKLTSNHQKLILKIKQKSKKNTKLNIQNANNDQFLLRSTYPEIYQIDQQKLDKQIISYISKQMVAYFQIKLRIRILSCKFKYILDSEQNYYLTSISRFIAVNMNPNQLKIIHDRLTELQQTRNQELAELKIYLQQKEDENLRNVLADLVADCLQKRKLQLKQCIYKRPSNQNLIKIFKKIFPSFVQQEVYRNRNWQNQFKVYLNQCRKKINKIIQQDEGIRILKRFGIIFYRTWD